MALADITFRGILEGYKFSQEALNTTIPNGGKVKLSFCGEHAGEYLKARADNGVLKGKATIKNANNQKLFKLHIENGKITGEYTQWENGLVRRKGLLVDCKRHGHGSEYDLSGFLIYKGEYDDDKGYLIYEGEYRDDKPTNNVFHYTAANKVEYECNYTETRGTVIRKRVDNPCYELEVDLENKPIRFRYVDRDKSVLVRLYLNDNMMLEYGNGDVNEGDYMHDPLKEFRRKGMSDYVYEHSLFPRSIPDKKTESVTVSMKPLEGDLVVTDPFHIPVNPVKVTPVEVTCAVVKPTDVTPVVSPAVTPVVSPVNPEEEKIMEIVDRMIQIEEQSRENKNWKELTDNNNKDYAIRFDPGNEGDTAGMCAIYYKGECMRIGRTKDGKLHGMVVDFDDGRNVRYQREYENGIEKKKWWIQGGKITKVEEYGMRGTS